MRLFTLTKSQIFRYSKLPSFSNLLSQYHISYLLPPTSIIFLLFSSLFLSFSLASHISHPSPVSAQGATAQCSLIGNNSATPFEQAGATNFTEAEYTLALYTGSNDSVEAIIQAISNSTRTVIVRIYGNPGNWDSQAYANHLNQISSDNRVNNKPFIAQVTHNEFNCGEQPQDIPGQTVLTNEVHFANDVINRISGNITPISGQIDHYCNPDVLRQLGFNSPVPPSSYLNAFHNIQGLQGVSLPFYTGDAGDRVTAISNFRAAANQAGKPIYITESGPFKRGSALPTRAEFQDYVTGVRDILASGLDIRTLLLFNAFGDNPDANFNYTKFFWSSSCRRAFRTQCTDPERVTQICFSGDDACASDPTLPIQACAHNCRLICDGTPNDPCKATPNYDCSIPYDAELMTKKNQELIPLRRGSISVNNFLQVLDRHMAVYLDEFTHRAKMAVGQRIDFVADINNPELCGTEIADLANVPNITDANRFDLINSCQHAVGETSITLILDKLNISGIIPEGNPDKARNETHQGLYDNKKASTKEGLGVTQKAEPSEIWWQHMAEIQSLKNSCYDHMEAPLNGYQPVPGHVVGYQQTKTWGDVRCMNYVKLDCPHCSGAFENERTAFTLPNGISQCRGGLTDECKNRITQLKRLGLTDVLEAIYQLPVRPIGRLPIVVGVDELPGTPDQKPDNLENPTDLNLFQGLLNISRKWFNIGGATNGNGQLANGARQDVNATAHRSYYASTSVVLGVDSQAAAQDANKAYIPSSQQVKPTLNEFPPNTDSNKPFGIRHLYYMTDGNPVASPTTSIIDANNALLRFTQLQYFFHAFSDDCQQNWNHSVDKTTSEQTVPLPALTRLLNVAANQSAGPLPSGADDGTAKLGNQIKQLGATQADIMHFMRCIAFPKQLETADNYSTQTMAIFTPGARLRDLIDPYNNTALSVTQPPTQSARAEIKGNGVCRRFEFFQNPATGSNESYCAEYFPTTTALTNIAPRNAAIDQTNPLTKITTGEGTIDAPYFFDNIARVFQISFRQIQHGLFQPHNSSNKCQITDKNYWECLTNRRTASNNPGGSGNTVTANTCPYTNATSPIISAADRIRTICEAAARTRTDTTYGPATQYNKIPGWLLYNIHIIEGGHYRDAVSSGNTTPLACTPNQFGVLGPWSVLVPACSTTNFQPEAFEANVCTWEGGLTVAVNKLLARYELVRDDGYYGSSGEHVDGMGHSGSQSNVSLQDRYIFYYRLGGLYNGRPDCVFHPGQGESVYSNGWTYCKYSVEGNRSDISCPGDPPMLPVGSPPGGGYTR